MKFLIVLLSGSVCGEYHEPSENSGYVTDAPVDTAKTTTSAPVAGTAKPPTTKPPTTDSDSAASAVVPCTPTTTTDCQCGGKEGSKCEGGKICTDKGKCEIPECTEKKTTDCICGKKEGEKGSKCEGG